MVKLGDASNPTTTSPVVAAATLKRLEGAIKPMEPDCILFFWQEEHYDIMMPQKALDCTLKTFIVARSAFATSWDEYVRFRMTVTT